MSVFLTFHAYIRFILLIAVRNLNLSLVERQIYELFLSPYGKPQITIIINVYNMVGSTKISGNNTLDEHIKKTSELKCRALQLEVIAL